MLAKKDERRETVTIGCVNSVVRSKCGRHHRVWNRVMLFIDVGLGPRWRVSRVDFSDIFPKNNFSILVGSTSTHIFLHEDIGQFRCKSHIDQNQYHACVNSLAF